jgi:hypothetical protein
MPIYEHTPNTYHCIIYSVRYTAWLSRATCVTIADIHHFLTYRVSESICVSQDVDLFELSEYNYSRTRFLNGK